MIKPFPAPAVSNGYHVNYDLTDEQLRWLRTTYRDHERKETALAMGVGTTSFDKFLKKYGLKKYRDCDDAIRVSVAPVNQNREPDIDPYLVAVKSGEIYSVLDRRDGSVRNAQSEDSTLPPCIGCRCINYGTPGCLDALSRPIKRCNAVF